MTQMTFAQFRLTAYRNSWCYEEKGLEIYVRRSIPKLRRGDYELANMTNNNRGNGSLTDFLNRWEPEYQFYVENIVNDRLEAYLFRRGYSYIIPPPLSLSDPPPCMLGPHLKRP
jgi:hypothetical protein